MSHTRSDSSESTSIYETPISSPSNESLLNSTRIDSSLFGNTSANTQSIDLLEFRRSFESIPTSVATESTLRQTTQPLNSRCAEDDQHFDAFLPDPSVWYSSKTMSSLIDSNRKDVYVMLMKYMSELEGQQLELIGVEQQIHSLSLKCRTIRENMSGKTQAINSLINEMLANKQTAQKETQTDIQSISVPQSCDRNKSILTPLKRESVFTFRESSPSVASEPKFSAKTDSSKSFNVSLFDNQLWANHN